jgi:hypothetical protein
MSDGRDHFGDGAYGTGYGKGTPSYRHGEAWADTIKGVFAPINGASSPTPQVSRRSTSGHNSAAANPVIEKWWRASKKIIQHQPLRVIDRLGRAIIGIPHKVNWTIAGLSIVAIWARALGLGTIQMTGPDIGGMCLFSALVGLAGWLLPKIVGGTIVGIVGATAMILTAFWQLFKLMLLMSAVAGILWLLVKGVQFGILFLKT